MQVKYSLSGKARPPKPIRLGLPGWAGSPDLKMENGSEPQPWHCQPFVDGAAYGLELVYHYETECHVYHHDGDLRIDWNYANEPGGILGADEFGVFAPTPSKFYFYASLVDIEVPPGYVLRTQPHPRFYSDDTGTVPAAVVGHVQSEWWPKKLFVVFKAPRPGERHIFRKDEPYVQLTCVPHREAYETIPMTPEENEMRRSQESRINQAKSFIANYVWQDQGGSEFRDHYRCLQRAFSRGGAPAVERTIDEGMQRFKAVIPTGKTVPEYMDLAFKYQKEGKLLEARELLFRARWLDPKNAEVASRLGVLAGASGLGALAVQMMNQAATLQPNNPAYQNNLAVALRRVGRLAEAENLFRRLLQLNPKNPLMLSNLGLTVAEQGRVDEGLAICQAALAMNGHVPAVHLRAGMVFAQAGRIAEARAQYEAALAIDPGYKPAREATAALPAGPTAAK